MSVVSLVKKAQTQESSQELAGVQLVTDVQDKLMPVGFVEEYSDARVSAKEKQPLCVGYPYIIYVPTEHIRNLPSTTVRGFISVGVEFKETRPLFYRCDGSFTRIRMKNGDLATATRVLAQLKEQKNRIFTNWK